MRIHFATLLLSAGLMAVLAGNARAAEDSIWSALVLGTNTNEPKPPPAVLEPYAAMLSRVFGYNQLELVGQHSELMDSDDERWLLPSKRLFLRVDSQRLDSGYKLQLALFRDKQLLVETTAKLGTHSPLVIRGPMYGEGQLIIVLVVQ